MDAAAQRREARRQKILARGSNRIDKIMGITTQDDATVEKVVEKEREPVADPFVIESMKRPSQDNDQENLVNSNDMSNSGYDQPPVNPDPVNFNPVPEPAEERQPVRRREPIRTHQTAAPAAVANSSPSSLENSLPPQLAALLSNLQSQDLAQGGIDEEQPLVESKAFYKIRTILCLLIGILIRLSFLFQIGPDYVQTAINPFVAFEVAIIGYQRAVGMALSGNVKGGLWLSALALSGFSQELINKYKLAMGIASAVLEDFTMYFFAFTVTHISCSFVY